MEVCKKLFFKNDENQISEIMTLFGWREISRKKIGRYFSCKYERETSNSKMYDLEKKYTPKFVLPMWLLVLLAGVAILLITIFVIRFAMRLENYNKMTDFACFMLPALLLILIDAAVFIFRYLNLMKNIETFNSMNYIRMEVHKINGQEKIVG